ncbi:MAG: hypothetical protein QNJ16_15940 [Rhodobacter sp.]|nr:hypothetical protein [Rhodobacter sp.]
MSLDASLQLLEVFRPMDRQRIPGGRRLDRDDRSVVIREIGVGPTGKRLAVYVAAQGNKSVRKVRVQDQSNSFDELLKPDRIADALVDTASEHML